MSHIAKLNVMPLKQRQPLTPAEQRRAKLVRALTEQRALAEARAAGTEHGVTVKRWVSDGTGSKVRVERAKQLKPWWWQDGDVLCLVVRYGAKVVELSKGKRAVRVENEQQVPEVLGTVIDAVRAGELDAAIDAVAGAPKLKKPKG